MKISTYKSKIIHILDLTIKMIFEITEGTAYFTPKKLMKYTFVKNLGETNNVSNNETLTYTSNKHVSFLISKRNPSLRLKKKRIIA